MAQSGVAGKSLNVALGRKPEGNSYGVLGAGSRRHCQLGGKLFLRDFTESILWRYLVFKSTKLEVLDSATW